MTSKHISQGYQCKILVADIDTEPAKTAELRGTALDWTAAAIKISREETPDESTKCNGTHTLSFIAAVRCDGVNLGRWEILGWGEV